LLSIGAAEVDDGSDSGSEVDAFEAEFGDEFN
jgi:hypothetical protein